MQLKVKLLSLIILFALVSCQPTPEIPVQPEFTEISTPTSLPTVTPTMTSTPIAETVVFQENASPNGEWTGTVILTSSETSKDLLFKVSRNHNNHSWIIEQKDVNKDDNPLPGFTYPYIFKWSQDGKYLYYSHLPTFNDGCFGYFQPGGLDLIKFDLSNGEEVTLRDDKATWMALSPDEEKLAYIGTFGGNVSILDFEEKTTTTFQLPKVENPQNFVTDTSDIYWSPDGKSLIYAHYIGACELIFPFSYIFQLFPETGQQTILVDNSEESFRPIEWNVERQILLEDSENKKWWLDATTKEITPANK
ncbi:MAG: hypothetical protein DPW18_02435 [Chloroflexi bacterium]|nr:hypothetical protein [Chloroflexota bacterium]MDL1942709.1 hypothetical protein [Chloroflexi bacterium CFX2]